MRQEIRGTNVRNRSQIGLEDIARKLNPVLRGWMEYHGRYAPCRDECGSHRTRKDNAPQNLAVLRHMAINLMQKDPTKDALRGKFKRAGCDEAYLTSLLALI